MKRKFVKVMLFGALTLAVSTTITSCKDYDDDVKNLQEQIDKINTSGPVSMEDMKTAIAAAKTELSAEIDKLSTALENKDASIKALETEIADLKTKLEAAQGDATAAKELATQLSDKQNELKTLVDANDATLKALKESYDKLTGAEGDIQTLQQFVADYQNNKVISENAKTDELLSAFINSTIAAKLDGKDLVEYINTAVSTAIATELTSVNDAITAITGKGGALDQIQDQLDKALNGDETNKGILSRLSDLEDTQNVINAFLEAHPDQYADFAAVLNQIETLRSNYETMFTPSNLQSKVEEAINAAMETTDFTFTQLVNDVKQHGLDIEAIKAMVQSVVYVPKNTDGTEEFTTLYAKATSVAPDYSIISRSEDLAVKFRVSPAKAALGFETGKYSLLMDAQVITRATNIFGVGKVTVEKDADGEPTGIISIPLIATAASTDYALCLMVKDNTEKVLTDVTSSYFPVLMTTKYLPTAVNAFKYVSGVASKDIIYNDNTSSVIFSTGGKVQATLYDSSTDATTNANAGSFADVPEGLKGVFKTTFALAVGATTQYFNIDANTGKVTLAPTAFDKVGLVGQEVGVNAITTVTGTDASITTDLTSGGAVTIAQKKENVTVNNAFEKDWKGDGEVTHTINMVDLYNQGAITEAEYKALESGKFAITADDGVTFARADDGNNTLTITVPTGKKVGEYHPNVVITVSGAKTITVNATVTVKSLTDVALTVPSAPQEIDAGVDAAQATAIAVGIGNVATLFPNYAEVNAKVEAAGGSIAFTVDGTGQTFSDPTLTITSAYEAPVTVTATVTCGEAEDATYTVTVVPDTRLSGTWTAPSQLAQTMASDKETTINLATGAIWKDYRGNNMWKDGAIVAGTGANGFAGGTTNPLAMYGLDAPDFALTGENADKFEVSAAGVLSYSTTGKDLPSRGGLTATVNVKIGSRWGGIFSVEPATVSTIEVTVPKN